MCTKLVKNMLVLFLVLSLALSHGARIDKKRTIAQPVKVYAPNPTPKFLRKISMTKSPGFSMACHVCLHLSEHFVATLHAHETKDQTKSQSGWRMDERKIVSFRGQDGKMMDMFDNLCKTFIPLDTYTECSNSVCEDLPPNEALKSQIRRSCTEFREDYEDTITYVSRRVDNDDKIAGETCKKISACNGKEKIQFPIILASEEATDKVDEALTKLSKEL